jgi:hypothetical protein
MQLGAPVSKVFDIRTIMVLQDVWADITINIGKTCRHVAIVQHRHCGPLTWHRYSAK